MRIIGVLLYGVATIISLEVAGCSKKSPPAPTNQTKIGFQYSILMLSDTSTTLDSVVFRYSSGRGITTKETWAGNSAKNWSKEYEREFQTREMVYCSTWTYYHNWGGITRLRLLVNGVIRDTVCDTLASVRMPKVFWVKDSVP